MTCSFKQSTIKHLALSEIKTYFYILLMHLLLNINSQHVCHFPYRQLTFVVFQDPYIYIILFGLKYSDLLKMGRNHSRNSWASINLDNSDKLLCMPSWQNSFSKSLPFWCQYSHSYPPMGNLENRDNKCPHKEAFFKDDRNEIETGVRITWYIFKNIVF